MPNLALAFDVIARDKATPTFDRVGKSAEGVGKSAEKGSSRMTSAFKGGFKEIGASYKEFAKGFAAGFATMFAADKVGDFIKDAVAEARESEKVNKITANAIKATGGAAKVTADQVGDLATAISNKTGIDDEAVQSGSNLLLTFKNVRNEVGKGNDIFNQATQAAVDLSAAGFGSIDSASKQLGKALNDPVRGMTQLNRVGVTFTDAQQKQVKAMVKAGDVLGAQKIIMKEVQSQVGGAAAASSTAGEKLSTAFANFKEQIGTDLLPIIDKFEGFLTAKVIPAMTQFFAGIQDGTGAGGKFADWMRTAWDILKGLWSVIKPFAPYLIGLAAAIKAVSIAQGILNAVLAANPIGLVVVALAAFALGLKYAWDHSETFRKIVTGAWSAVQTAVSAVVSWFTKTVPAAFQSVLSWAKAHWPLILGIITGPIGLAVGAVIKHWDTIKSKTSAAWAAVKGTISSTWNSISSKISSVVTTVKKTLSDAWSSIKSKASDAWGGIVSGIRGAFRGLVRVLASPLNAAIDVLNSFIRGANALLGKIPGVSLRIPSVSHVGVPKGYASGGLVAGRPAPYGVDNMLARVDGKGIVGIASGEVVMSNRAGDYYGRGFLQALNQRLVPKGDLLGFAGGGLVGKIKDIAGDVMGKVGSVLSIITNPRKALEGLLGSFGDSLGGMLVKGVGKAAIDGLVGVVKKAFSAGSVGSVGGGVSRWSSVALQAMSLAGLPGSYLPLLLHRMQVESGGNPRAINLWDSNAKAGMPSQGLMQVIPPTFAAFAGALRGRGILDPLANIYAAIKYTLSRYGLSGIGAAWGGTKGYSIGGPVRPVSYAGVFDRGGVLAPGLNLVDNRLRKPELLERVNSGQPTGDTYNFNGPMGPSALDVAREVEARRRMRESLHPRFN